jgi:hypothetical protein
MLKLSLGILFIVTLFKPTIQQYSDEYCAKYVATFPLTLEACIDNSDIHNESSLLYKIMNKTNAIIQNFSNNNCDGSGIFTFTYSFGICKNNMIITYNYPEIKSIIPKTPTKKENWNEYIVISGSSFTSNQRKSPKKVLSEENYSPQIIISDILIGFSAFLFTVAFFISMAQ